MTIHELSDASLPSALPPNLAPLSRFPDSAAIGRLQGDSTLVLGQIIDAALVPSEAGSYVALLDKSYGIVRLFTLGGTPIAHLGKMGQGPGEFRSPLALAYRDGSVLVLDAAMKVESYGSAPPWEPAGAIRFPVVAQDMCAVDRGIVVMGTRFVEADTQTLASDQRTVHLISRDDHSVSSFSEPYDYDGAMALWSMTQGRMTCDRNTGMIWIAYSVLHEIHALDLDGNLLWISRLVDMAHPDVIETGNSQRTRIREDLESSDRIEVITHVSLIDDAVLAVQIASHSIEGIRTREREVTHRTYFIDANDGSGVGVMRAGHQIIGGADGLAVLYRDAPFPQFAIMSLRVK